MATCTVVATFNGTQDSVTVAFTGITTNPPKVFGSTPLTSDGSSVSPSLSAVSNTGATINVPRFSGTITVVAMD
jgi:hypothetical protein